MKTGFVLINMFVWDNYGKFFKIKINLDEVFSQSNKNCWRK